MQVGTFLKDTNGRSLIKPPPLNLGTTIYYLSLYFYGFTGFLTVYHMSRHPSLFCLRVGREMKDMNSINYMIKIRSFEFYIQQRHKKSTCLESNLINKVIGRQTATYRLQLPTRRQQKIYSLEGNSLQLDKIT